MQRLGIQSNELARMVGVKPGPVSNWLSGEKNLAKGKNMRKLCDVLGVEHEWFLGIPGKYPEHQEGAAELSDMSGEVTLRRRAHGHLDAVLDACQHDEHRLSWTYIELQEHFPLRSRRTVDDDACRKYPDAPGNRTGMRSNAEIPTTKMERKI